jgi:hypothetical protein
MDFSQQYDPQSTYRRPVPGQPRGHASAMRGAEASDWDRGIPRFTDAYARTVFLVPTGECW